MKHLSVLIKPASSLCNLRCKYCFYSDVSSHRDIRSFGIMEQETAKKLLDNLSADLEAGDMLTLAFQGGEPTMAGLPWFRDFVQRAKETLPHVTLNFSLQTNGILLDESWCEFLKEHHFLVGLSWDGPTSLHNKNRVDPNGHGTWATVRNVRRLLKKHSVKHNILCVLTNDSARYPQQIWNFIEEQNIEYIQFIPCLDELAGGEHHWALTPQRFCSFYTALFSFWHKAVQQGKYISVKLFDDIANLFLYRQVTACGLAGRCSMQYVVEADGGVYPCDFYVLDQYRLGSFTEQTPRQLFEEYLCRNIAGERKTLPPTCSGCPFLGACHGGCRRMENTIYTDGSYCGYRELLQSILQPLCHDAQKLAGLSSK